MSECVVRMEMPQNCCECQLRKEDYDTGEEFCPFTGVECLSIGRQDNCPIVCALPENHGRLSSRQKGANMSDLIDRQALLDDIYLHLPTSEMCGDVISKEDMRLWITCRIENAPTIAKLPDNHGDLIDRNDYIKKWKETKKKRLFINGLDVAWLAHVTIPAERSET